MVKIQIDLPKDVNDALNLIILEKRFKQTKANLIIELLKTHRTIIMANEYWVDYRKRSGRKVTKKEINNVIG